ncbi:MAG: C45 family autoproteolytic acyltransferase/hydrolase [Candidatus Binatia bacterium]|nr:C45 family autoproteolytic acyltransferase/hydrolase [Candidatus Binatia bacterium]
MPTTVLSLLWWNRPLHYQPRPLERSAARGEWLRLAGYPVLRLRGSPYEKGYQHGALYRDAVRANVRGFLDYVYKESPVGRRVTQAFLDFAYACCRPYLPLAYQQELQGLAEGAGLSLRDIQRVHAAPDLFELRGLTSCASFAAFGRATADGRLYHLRNLDWIFAAGIQQYPLLLVYVEEGVVNISYAGFIGVISGMNRAGISVGQIGSTSRDWTLRGLPMPFLLRQVLEQAKTLADAVHIVRTAPRTVGHNYIIASGTEGKAVALETTKSLCVAFGDDRAGSLPYALPVTDVLYRADLALSPEVRRWQVCSNGYPNLPYGSTSYEVRYRRQGELLTQHHGRITPPVAKEIARAIAPASNLQSVIYSPATLEFWVANADRRTRAAKRPYQYFSLAQLLHAPEVGPWQEASVL